MSGARVLVLDIETSPNLADVWGLFQQNVSLNQLHEASRVLCLAAKWHGDKHVMFRSEPGGGMLEAAHTWLDEADVVVHYNGKRFDIPHLNRSFLEYGMTPPSPYKQVDLYQVVKSKFRFVSNKLAHVVSELGLSGKLGHSGHELWTLCLAGDPRAWKEMEKYNKQDVVVTEELYDRLLPWIDHHPNLALYVDIAKPLCSRCTSPKMQKRGVAYTALGAFQRFQCQACGGWARSGTKVNAVDTRGIAS